MNFFKENLKETIEAPNALIEDKERMITVKKVRNNNQIKSYNRSKINFYWRSLKFLAGKDILEENGIKKPKSYNILTKRKIAIEVVYP